jgi:hypothetical protein
MTVPGPFTMPQQAQNDYYPSEAAAAMDYAVAVNEEIRDLFAAGADIVQIDEPYMQARPDKARQFGLKALNRALEGITGTTAVGLLLPARAGGVRLHADLYRDGAIEARLLGAHEARRQEDHGGLPRPERPDGGGAGDDRRTHQARPVPHQAGGRHPGPIAG